MNHVEEEGEARVVDQLSSGSVDSEDEPECDEPPQEVGSGVPLDEHQKPGQSRGQVHQQREPDEFVELSDGGCTWKRLLERAEQEAMAELETAAETETRIPDS